MSLSTSKISPDNRSDNSDFPSWFSALLDSNKESKFRVIEGILRAKNLLSHAQQQTSDTFGYKWQKRDTFESESSLKRMTDWLVDRYGPVPDILKYFDNKPIVMDAGCGAGMSGYCYWGPHMDDIHYLGVDISEAVDVAKTRGDDFPGEKAYIQSDLNSIPIRKNCVDIAFSEGVLHHTDSTQNAIDNVGRHVKPGGIFMFYVYRQKGPIREYTDDYIRELVKDLPPQEAWDLLMPLTKLGKALGELDIDIDIPEDIKLLDIPKGSINIQRFFYWHVMKTYYRPEMTLDEMNHINFDWYTPINAHRQTLEDTIAWTKQAGFEILSSKEEEAGITVIAQKKGT